MTSPNAHIAQYACPACKAPKDEPCVVRLDGMDTSGWMHDARILAPVLADLAALSTTPTQEGR